MDNPGYVRIVFGDWYIPSVLARYGKPFGKNRMTSNGNTGLADTGKIAILTNAGEKSQEIFELYKFRNDVEESFDVFKNLLMTDTPYLRDDDSLRGYLFVSFISLIVYYRILKLLKEKGINDRVSVKDAILQLSKIYLTDAGGRTIVAEIPKKVRDLAELLGMEPDLFPKSVPS